MKSLYVLKEKPSGGFDILFPRKGIGFMYRSQGGVDTVTCVMVFRPLYTWQKPE
jgi:hypothetical protein